MKKFRKWATTLSLALVLVLGGIGLAACNDPGEGGGTTTTTYSYTVGKYTIDFGGNKEGEKYDNKATTWTMSKEDGFDAVFTLKGVVPRSQKVGDEVYGGSIYTIALIRFTSTIEKVEWDAVEQEGFYLNIYKNFVSKDQPGEADVRHGSFTTGTGTTSDTTFFFYNQIDNTVRTKVVKISFDGTEENAAWFKFVIDPVNYTLESPTEVTE